MNNWFKKIYDVFNDVMSPHDRRLPLAHLTQQDVLDAIEAVVDGTEPQIRYVSSYKKQLEKSVVTSLLYINDLVNTLPGAKEINHKNYTREPHEHAYFASVGEIKDVFSNSNELKTFFYGSEDEQAYALLCMKHEEKTILGVEMQNNILSRDVLQISENFSEHKILSPTGSEAQIRECVKKCIFDGLITHVLKKLVGLKSEYRDLHDQQSALNSRLRSRQAKGSGLTKLLTSVESMDSEYQGILEKIEENEIKLKEMPPKWKLPNYYIEQVNHILNHPEAFIRLETSYVNISKMGIKVNDKSSKDASLIRLDELTIDNVLKRVIVIVSYPRNEM